MLRRCIGQCLNPGRAVIQAINVGKLFAARIDKGVTCFQVDFFQRFQAITGKARANQVHTFQAGCSQRNQRGLGVRLKPFGLAKAGLKSNLVSVLAQLQFFGQQACGFVAFAVVGVAQVQRTFRYAMKSHDQFFSLAIGLPVRFNPGSKGVDVAGCIVVVVDESELRQAAHFACPCVHGIKHTGRSGGAVLGVGRQNQHPAHAIGFELIKL